MKARVRNNIAFCALAVVLLAVISCAAPAAEQRGAQTAGERLGGTVSVLATWGGDEQDSFLAMVRPFEERTGVRVEYEGHEISMPF